MPRPDTGDLYIWWLSALSEQLPYITGLREVLLTCVRVPEVREMAGQFERGRYGGRGGAWAPHTIHTYVVSFLLAVSQEKWLNCPVKPHTEHVLQGPAWQKLIPWKAHHDNQSLLIRSPFQNGNTESSALGGLSVVLLCTQPRFGKLTSFLLVIPAPRRLHMHISGKV